MGLDATRIVELKGRVTGAFRRGLFSLDGGERKWYLRPLQAKGSKKKQFGRRGKTRRGEGRIKSRRRKIGLTQKKKYNIKRGRGKDKRFRIAFNDRKTKSSRLAVCGTKKVDQEIGKEKEKRTWPRPDIKFL